MLILSSSLRIFVRRNHSTRSSLREYASELQEVKRNSLRNRGWQAALVHFVLPGENDIAGSRVRIALEDHSLVRGDAEKVAEL